MVAGWTPGPADQPLPPQNVEVLSPFVPGVLDLRWDNPAILARNTVHTVLGVNIWRSDVSDRGPFFRLNDFPLGGGFYRDQTTSAIVGGEVISWSTSWISKGDAPNDRRWEHPPWRSKRCSS